MSLTRLQRIFFMTKPTLPSYSCSETAVFHPAFKYAVEQLLNNKGLSNAIEIQREFPTPTGPVDFALIDKSTNKVILPIEIKRTQSSVRGGGRRQARDYWSNLGATRQTEFYCVSNLEVTELFRNDNARPSTSSQLVNLQHAQSGVLGYTDTHTFYNNLIRCIGEVLEIVLGNIQFQYALGLKEFQKNVEAAVENQSKWHQIFITTGFEYIRGAATNEKNLKHLTSSWKSADFYKNNPNRLNDLGRKVDFEHIFCDPVPFVFDPNAFLPSILLESYESGRLLGRGDDIADLVNLVLAPKGIGIVETDAELAQLMAIISKVALGRELAPNERVLDPASGSGRLLTALPTTAFPSINPKQIWANEIEPKFAESLSLRLGLAFSSVINPSNAPKITISGIEKVEKHEFIDVKLVVMNPPFLSGVLSYEIKNEFTKRIKAVSNIDSKINEGQISLESLFLELVSNLTYDDSIITTIFPVQHLHRFSPEVIKLRKFLVTDFGLSHIVLYPSLGVFESVKKQTVILVGKKGNSNPDVSLVEVQKQISDVDFNQLYSGLASSDSNPTHGVVVRSIKRKSLYESAENGWKEIIGAGPRILNFMEKYFIGFKSLSNLPRKQVRRGTVGNNGNTDLTVFNYDRPDYPSIVNIIPKDWLRPVLNTTEKMPRVLNKYSAPEMSFMPPESAYVEGDVDNNKLKEIVGSYLAIKKQFKGPQTKKQKTKDEVIKNIKSNQINFGPGWVLIQRASRKKGEISTLEDDGVLLSTNVPMINLPDVLDRKLLASWLLSVFGQLQLEYFSTPQEGMRKLEMIGIKKILYPDFSKISLSIRNELIESFKTDSAILFDSVTPRLSDKLWADILDYESSSLCKNEAISLLQEMIDERKGFG